MRSSRSSSHDSQDQQISRGENRFVDAHILHQPTEAPPAFQLSLMLYVVRPQTEVVTHDSIPNRRNRSCCNPAPFGLCPGTGAKTGKKDRPFRLTARCRESCCRAE